MARRMETTTPNFRPIVTGAVPTTVEAQPAAAELKSSKPRHPAAQDQVHTGPAPATGLEKTVKMAPAPLEAKNSEAARLATIATIARRFPAEEGPLARGGGEADAAVLREAAAQLRAWLAGERGTFSVGLDQPGTPFQRAVWDALRAIPPGETRTYGALAAALGRPGAARAVGAACGRNRLALFVPCHRAVGADGALTGFAWGLERKRWLLEHERRVTLG